MFVTLRSFIASSSSAYLVIVFSGTDVKLALVSSAFNTYNSSLNLGRFSDNLLAYALAFNNKFC